MNRPAPVAQGDDRRQLPDAAGPGVSTGHQLGTWPTSEVEDVDTAAIFSSAARTTAPIVWTPILTVGAHFDDRARELDQLQVIRVSSRAGIVSRRTLQRPVGRTVTWASPRAP